MEYGLYKRLCVLAGMVALCASCSVRRSASDHSHYRDQERQVLESLDTSMDVRLASSNTVRDRWRNIRIIRREFDLERQPDENGRYPVKAETTLEGEEHENERKEEAESQKKEENESVSPGRKPAMRKSGPEIPNSTPMSARTPSGGGRSA